MPSAEGGLVGFDATTLEMEQRAGISHYTAQLLAALVARDDGWQYALLASKPLKGKIPAGKTRREMRGQEALPGLPSSDPGNLRKPL